MLSENQLTELTAIYRQGADDAASALSIWLERPVRISVEHVEQLGLTQAAGLLGTADEAVCACVMSLQGTVSGQLMLAFDDDSGLILADFILSRKLNRSTRWEEVELSAALETANIVGCAYLNALSRCTLKVPTVGGVEGVTTCIPSPPHFVRDFGPSLMQFVLLNHYPVPDVVFLTRTEFCIDNAQVTWDLLFLPDTESLNYLQATL